MEKKEKAIHIITLNIPDPPDYGGMIDSYYRILALHSLGIKIRLHCFEYNRQPSKKLESMCEQVYYYTRQEKWWLQLSWRPYVVSSRNTGHLLKHLMQDNAPILFDGLHTTYHLTHRGLKNRIKAVRVHNIEHRYYYTMAKFESNLIKKLFFFTEAVRLYYYERVLYKAQFSFTVSPPEQKYFQMKYKNADYIPSFHPYNHVKTLTGKGTYLLFHGDLSVIENSKACAWVIREVFSKIKFPCLIAGKNPPEPLKKLADGYDNITMIANPTFDQMNNYIREAHINVVIALQSNGLKIKLLYSLYAGRFCLVNPPIIEDTILDKLCYVANTPNEFLKVIDLLMKTPFTPDMINVREAWLSSQYDNRINAMKMMALLS